MANNVWQFHVHYTITYETRDTHYDIFNLGILRMYWLDPGCGLGRSLTVFPTECNGAHKC
jgi:hypothetical protein